MAIFLGGLIECCSNLPGFQVSHYAITAPELRAVVLNLSPRLQPPELFRPRGIWGMDPAERAKLKGPGLKLKLFGELRI